jgi:hypothetical protein
MKIPNIRFYENSKYQVFGKISNIRFYENSKYQVFGKIPNIRFYENFSIGSQLVITGTLFGM